MAFTWTVTDATHTFEPLDVVYLDASGDWQLAEADPVTPLLAEGVIKSVVAATSYVVFVGVGVLNIAAHGAGNAGDEAFTSTTTAGEVVSSVSSGNYKQRVWQVLDADNLFVNCEIGIWIP